MRTYPLPATFESLERSGLLLSINAEAGLFYNMTITTISVVVALVIGGIETLGLIAGRFGFEGGFWSWISELNANFGALGYVIVALFAISWVVSFFIYQASGYDRRDKRAT